MEASPTCFWALLRGMKQAFSDTRCNCIWCTRCSCYNSCYLYFSEPRNFTPLKQELHRCSRGATSAVSGPYSDATEPGYTALLTAFTGLFQARQDGGHSSVPNLRSLGSSPCYAAEAAWWYHGAKQARTVVPPKPRLNRENRHPWYHVSEAVPPQRPVVPPPVVSPVFPFVTPLCPPFAP